MEEFVAKGATGYLKVTPTKVILEHKGFLAMTYGTRGVKEIPISSITSIQLKKPGLFSSGYIEFSFSGGKETKGKGVKGAYENENAMVFHINEYNDFLKAKELIEKYMEEAKTKTEQSSASTRSVADEIEKLAKLKEQGILSEEEFESAKKKLLGI